MVNNHSENTGWDSFEYPHVISVTKLVFQNFSETPEASTHSYHNDNKPFDMSDPFLEYYGSEMILALRSSLQYFAAFATILLATWTLNKVLLKSYPLTAVIETLGSYLIFLPVLPALAGFFALVLGFRTGIRVYLKLFYNPGKTNKVSLLDPRDACWAYDAYGSSSLSAGLYVVEGTSSLSKVREAMKRTVESEVVGGKMSRELVSVLGFPCWQEIDDLDIQDYVKLALDTGVPSTESDVFDFIKTFQDEPIVGKAPWMTYVIPDLVHSPSTPPNSPSCKTKKHYGLLFRMHHSVMDGISVGNVIHSALADKQFKFCIDPLKSIGPTPTKLKNFLTYTLGFLSLPRVALKNAFLMDTRLSGCYLAGPRLTGPKTVTWSRQIKMDGLKQLKNRTKTSVMSVLLSALGGAYRQLSLKNGKRPTADFLHSMFPAAMLPYPDRKLRNGFTYLIAPFYVGEGASPLKRLELNHLNIQRCWSGNELIVGNYMLPVLYGVLPLFLQSIVASFLHVTSSLSNIPGALPKENILICGGDKIVDIGLWTSIKFSVGLGIGLISHGDYVRASMIGDKAYFPNDLDVQFLTEAFERELAFLAEAIDLPQNDLFRTDADF